MAKSKVLIINLPPDANMDDVGAYMQEAIDRLHNEGFELHSIQGHTGIVNGVPCTIGYNVIGIKAAKAVPQKSGIPIVVAA